MNDVHTFVSRLTYSIAKVRKTVDKQAPFLCKVYKKSAKFVDFLCIFTKYLYSIGYALINLSYVHSIDLFGHTTVTKHGFL
jgi:hypothetical protein